MNCLEDRCQELSDSRTVLRAIKMCTHKRYALSVDKTGVGSTQWRRTNAIQMRSDVAFEETWKPYIIGVKKRCELAGKSLKSKAKRCELADIVVQR